MNRLIVFAALLIFCATVVAGIFLIHQHRLNAHVLPPGEVYVPMEDFAYEVWPGSKMSTYNLRYGDVKLAGDDPRLRLVFNYQDVENHHYVELSPGSISVVAMQNGIGRVLARTDTSLPVDEAMNVLVKRRLPDIRVAVNREMLLEACDETFTTGQTGFARTDEAVEVSAPAVEPVGKIYFADDFMRVEGADSPWTALRGPWKLSDPEHAALSANAFQYNVENKEAETDVVSVAGNAFWDDYSFEAAVSSDRDTTPFGLYVYYQSENNYYRFQWTPDKPDSPGSGRKQLIRMLDGEETVLAERTGGYKSDQWYKLRVQVSGRRLQAFIDETLVFDVRDAHLIDGMVGLYGGPKARLTFDDVFVRSYEAFEDRFTETGRGAWTFMGGTWDRIPQGDGNGGEPTTGILSVRSSGGSSRAVVGSAGWKNYVLDTEICTPETGRTGIVLCYQDETRYYETAIERLDRDREKWTLRRVLDGEETPLDEVVLEAPAGARRVQAGIRDGYISIRVNDRKLLEGFDTTLRHGRPGVFAANVDSASFGPVRVDWPLESPPLLTLNEIFEHEESMRNWSDKKSDWQSVKTRDNRSFLLNKRHFPGDATIEAEVPTLTGQRSRVALGLSVDETGGDSGYTLRLTRPDDKENTPRKLELLRKGKLVVSTNVPVSTKISTLTFRRLGGYLIARGDGRPLLYWRDRELLTGDRLGYYANNPGDAVIDLKTVSVSSPNVHQYLFRRAYADWRVAGGIWQVTSRWTCDPRWTFFSGRSWSLAAIWNKRKFKGDVTVDFYAGPKMDRHRGSKYEYAADLNCVIGGDGVDLNSGYSFLFGGFDDTKTCIMKGDQVLKENTSSSALIPRQSGIHRRWFHVKAQKKGDRLRMWIDDRLVLDVVDKKPLRGDREAIWTYNTGMMVARVMISAEQTDEYESPDVYQPGRTRCVYDANAGKVAAR